MRKKAEVAAAAKPPKPERPAARAHPRDHVGGLEKGLRVLAAFDGAHTRLTISDAARLTDVSPASARRSLLTLWKADYLDSDGKRFWMKPKVLMLAAGYSSSRALPRLVQPLLDSLSERTRESASAAQLYGDQVIIVARSTARRSLTVGLGPGSRLPVWCSATGRMLLASLSDAEALRLIQQARPRALTPLTVTAPREVLERVRLARRRGYSLSNEEIELGVRSLAVPLYDRSGQVAAALNLSVRAERMAADAFVAEFLPVLQRAQRRMEQVLPEI